MEDIVIIGAGGLGREIAWLIKDINDVQPTWKILGFAAADPGSVGKTIGRHGVICTDLDLVHESVAVAVAVGASESLRSVATLLRHVSRLRFPNLVHPSVIWDRERVRMGQGNLICAGNIMTTDIQMGSFNIFNLDNSCGHDMNVGDFCVINPHCSISGNVTMADSCTLGTGCRILQSCRIGEGATIGAGSVVIGDVGPNTTVVGNPARVIFDRKLK